MKRLLLTALALLVYSSDGYAQAPVHPTPPNVVFILTDDVGVGMLARYHEQLMGRPAVVATPNLDRLCREGMLFTDAVLPAALCAPNRFSLLTGSYPHRSRPAGTWRSTASTGFHFGTDDKSRQSNPHRTIGSALKAVGYRTAYFGKMHLGGDFFDKEGNLLRMLTPEQLPRIDLSRRMENGMLAHGFDYTFVSPDGIQGPLYVWLENDLYRPVSTFAAEVPGVDKRTPSELRTFAEAERVGAGRMLVAGYGDSNFDTSEHGAILGHFATRFIEEHRRDLPDTPFLVYYATPGVHEPITPAADLVGKSGKGLLADFILDMDRQVGRLLDTLDRLKIAENTVVIFTSDNGGIIKSGEDMIAAGQHPSGPFRGNKSTIHEGGHRVPFIWRWGNGNKDRSVIPPGVVCAQLVSVIDWVPTLIDFTGGAVPADQHMDSTSLRSLLTSSDPDAQPPVRTWHLHRGDVVNPRGSARMNDPEGKWVLINPTDKLPMEFYNLANDLSQKTNLVGGYKNPRDLPEDHPHRTRVLKMQQWFRDHSRAQSPRTQPEG